VICQDELGQLEAHRADFTRRGVRIVAVSLEGLEEAAATHATFPHLTVVADRHGNLSSTVGVVLPRSSPAKHDTAAPTTVLVDPDGVVRWIHRPMNYLVRLPAAEMLAAVDKYLTALVE
jgi:peroxiredoxin